MNKSSKDYQRGHHDGFVDALRFITGFAEREMRNYDQIYSWLNEEDEI